MNKTIEEIEDLYSTTGFEFQNEVETLDAMLTIAASFHSGNMPGLKETRETVKKSVKELCAFFCKFVDCL